MANLFVNLPLPALNGAGASVATDGMGRDKTIVSDGSFEGAVLQVEVSVDGGITFAPVAVIQSGALKQVIPVAADFMRVSVSGRKAGLPFSANIDVGANDNGALFIALPLPALNGAGASVAANTLGSFSTFVVGGSFAGAAVQVQASEDGVDWAVCAQFAGAGGIVSKDVIANFYRVFVSGRKSAVPFTASVAVGSINDAITAGGGSADRSGCLIFQPGGAETGPVIFNAWADLITQLAVLRAAANGGGCYTIQFDDSLGAVSIPAGAYDMTDVDWEGTQLGGGSGTAVGIVEGATFTDGPTRIKGLLVLSSATTTSAFTYANTGSGDAVELIDTTIGASVVAVPVFKINGTFTLTLTRSTLGFFGNQTLEAGFDGGVFIKLGERAGVLANTLITSGDGGIGIEFNASSAGYDEDQAFAPAAAIDIDSDVNNTVVRHYTTEPIATSSDNAFPGYLNRFNASGPTGISANLVQALASSNRYQWALIKETSGLPSSDGDGSMGMAITPFAGDTIDDVLGPLELLPGAQAFLVSNGLGEWAVAAKTASVPEKCWADVVIDPLGGIELRIAFFNVGTAVPATGVVKNGTGDFSVTFSNPAPAGYYPVVTTSIRGTTPLIVTWDPVGAGPYTGLNIKTYNLAGVLADAAGGFISIAVHLAPEIVD